MGLGGAAVVCGFLLFLGSFLGAAVAASEIVNCGSFAGEHGQSFLWRVYFLVLGVVLMLTGWLAGYFAILGVDPWSKRKFIGDYTWRSIGKTEGVFLGLYLAASVVCIAISVREVLKDADSYRSTHARLGREILETTQAIQKTPGDSDLYYRRAIAYAKRGLHDQAIADFTQAMETRRRLPNHTQYGEGSMMALTLRMRAESYLGAGDYAKAHADVDAVRGMGEDPGERLARPVQEDGHHLVERLLDHDETSGDPKFEGRRVRVEFVASRPHEIGADVGPSHFGHEQFVVFPRILRLAEDVEDSRDGNLVGLAHGGQFVAEFLLGRILGRGMPERGDGGDDCHRALFLA
jgi:hypothetical protein